MTSRAHCMLVFVVKKRTKWRLVVEAGSLVVFQAVLRTVKETRICRFMFSQRKRIWDVAGYTQYRGKMSIRPLDTEYVACISKEGKNLHEQCSCYFSPEPRRKLIVNKCSTPNQETQPSPSLPASTTTPKADESERDRQEIRRLREELGNVLRLKGSLERDLFILKFGLKRFWESEKDMIFYTSLTSGQFVALFNFLNAHGICYRLNYWGSDYA